MPQETPLPQMPFGHASAVEFGDEAACGDFLARLPDAPSRFGAIGSADDFRARMRNVVLPGVSLVAGASTPKATVHQGPRPALVIPFGRCETVLRAEGGEFRWAAPHHAFFIPAGLRVEAESTTGAFLRLDIVGSALAGVAAGMAGDGRTRAKAIDVARPRVVAMRARGMHWLSVIRALCGTVDAFACDSRRLTAAGLEDTILRTVVMMLEPETPADLEFGERASRGFDLDPLLEQVMAGLDGRVTLGDMERWSGRTARAIQLAFQRRFGIGPMRWVRQRRLELVRAKLLSAPEGATVRGIVESCAIPRMATFVAEYVDRFGERPSETLRRRA